MIHTYCVGYLVSARNAIDESDFFIPVTEPKITFVCITAGLTAMRATL